MSEDETRPLFVDPLVTVEQPDSARPKPSVSSDRPDVDGDPFVNPTGRYIPIRPHARGGLGEVYVALDQELSRNVALKAIKAPLADDPANQARFVREAEITGKLEHPGIVPVYGLGRSEDGRPYYAMRFIEGESLDIAIDRFHTMANETSTVGERSVALLGLLRRFIDVCYAIEYAHSRSILHRDLKPSNIMLGKHGETLVVDWGLAKYLSETDERIPSATAATAILPPSHDSEQTLPGSRIGTPAFMSPEQAAGRLEQLGPRSDIYNLGATLYYLLTGQAPFDNAPAGVLILHAQLGDFPRPSQVALWPVPSTLEAICLKAMALRPENRYETARELAEDIERWFADEPVLAEPESIWKRLARWSRRHRTWVRAATAVLAGLLIVMAVANLMVHRAWQREQSVRLESEHLAANLDLDKGISLCEQGMTSLGLLRLAHALSITPTNASELRKTILLNLSAWRDPAIPLKQMFPHPDAVWSAVFSPDGKRVLTGSSVMVNGKLHGEARVWDAETGQLIGEPIKHAGYVSGAAYSPDGKLILTGCADRAVRRFEASTGNPVGTPVFMDAPISTVIFAPDGKSFLAVADRSVRAWKTTSGQEITPAPPIQTSPLYPIAFSPDGSMFATGAEDGTALLWDTRTHTPIGKPMTHNSAVNCLAFSPDGTRLVTGDEDGVIQTWSTSTHERLATQLAHRSEVYGLAFSPDGKTLASAGDDGTARYWDVASGQALGLPMSHLGAVNSIAFSTDGKSLVTSCGDAVVRTWQGPTTESLLARRNTSKQIKGLTYSMDGEWFATIESGRTVQIRDAVTLEPLGEIKDHPADFTTARFSPDGSTLVTGDSDGRIHRWSTPDAEPLGELARVSGPVVALAYRPDGLALLAAGEDAAAQLIDSKSGAPVGLPLPLESEITALGFTPDGKTIVTAEGNSARIWPVNQGGSTPRSQEKLDGHQGLVTCLAFSRNGYLVATGSEDGTARIWDVQAGRQVGPPLPHGASVNAVAFGANDRMLLTGCNDQSARLWSLPHGKTVGPPLKHQGRISAVGFHPSGQSFLTGSFDRSIRRWRTPIPWLDDVDQCKKRVRALTGMTLAGESDPSARGTVLDAQDWAEERSTLIEID